MIENSHSVGLIITIIDVIHRLPFQLCICVVVTENTDAMVAHQQTARLSLQLWIDFTTQMPNIAIPQQVEKI